jgi:enoyl-CoA hydratase/carnithine racemase
MTQSRAMPTQLLTERQRQTLVLTLSGPDTRNSLSPQALIAGIEALAVAESDDSVRCVVLRGDGGHFCSGGDLRRLQATRALGDGEGRRTQRQSVERLAGLVEALRTFPKPVIAAVEGFAAGAGFSLALACDLVIAADDARFVMSYGRVGLTPDGGATWQLARMLPRARALRAIWLHEPLDAATLRDWGLVDELAPSGQTLPAALALADRLAQLAPNAVASAKELVNAAPTRSLREQFDAEAVHFVDNLFHANGGEGIAAFLERRAPNFE